MAYRRADHERWQQMDFVLGIKIELSNQHPVTDICDFVQGDYPKDFVFDGWHPQCFCYATPILISEDEMAKVSEAFARGETYIPKGKPVTDTPKGFKKWVKDHKEQIQKAKNPPYWVRNNKAVVNGIWGKKKVNMADKTPKTATEQKTAIKNSTLESRKKEYQKLLADSNYKEVEFDEKTGGLKATHINHNFDKHGGKYEIHVQNVGYRNGHSVILEEENHTNYKVKNVEGKWDGYNFEIATAETGTVNNIRNALKHCASKPAAEYAIVFMPGDLNWDNLRMGIAKYNGLKHTKQYRKFRKIIIINQDKIIL